MKSAAGVVNEIQNDFAKELVEAFYLGYGHDRLSLKKVFLIAPVKSPGEANRPCAIVSSLKHTKFASEYTNETDHEVILKAYLDNLDGIISAIRDKEEAFGEEEKVLSPQDMTEIETDLTTIKNGSPSISLGKIKFTNQSGNDCRLIYDSEGNIFIGEVSTAEISNGQGKLISTYGVFYEGNFENGRLHGQGKLTYKNGDVYEGEFKNDKREGQGKLTYKNYEDGDVYEGNFEDDKRNGQGKLTYKNGDVYEGEFKDDYFDGLGKFTSSEEGFVYEGEFKNGKMHGEGKLNLTDGLVYEGGFENGKFHGQGKLTVSDGHVFEGNFEYGRKINEDVSQSVSQSDNANPLPTTGGARAERLRNNRGCVPGCNIS